MEIGKIVKILKKKVGEDKPYIQPTDPFQVLISTVLSQRTRDENTRTASERLFLRFTTPKQLAGANLGEIEKLIKPSGFYRVKARYIRQIAKEIIERFGGKVPDNINDLLSLTGVGRKTANCVLVYAFRKPAIPVDTHVHRISNRLGLVRTKTPKETEIELVLVVPKRYWIVLNELMVRHGQQTCRPLRPLCHTCPITKYCKHVRIKK